ncbi:MAG: ABC transporter permease [Candidatus Latescibacterota bacterium]|jgi:putative ABC transport system permease protein
MLRSYLLTAWRHLVRRRVYTAINLLGLAVGVAFCLLAWTLVAYERSFDAFHTKADRVYRVVVSFTAPQERLVFGQAGLDFGPALAAEIPLVARVGRLVYSPNTDRRVVRAQGRTAELGVGWADSAFYQVLSFPVVAGDPLTAAMDRGSAVISRSVAERLFGLHQVVGQTLEVREKAAWLPYTVGAVIEVPPTSSYALDIVLPFALGPDRGGNYVETLVEVARPEDRASVQALLPAFTERHYGAIIASLRKQYGATASMAYFLQPLRAIHRDPSVRGTDRATLPIFGWAVLIVALLVLLIACANFVSLSLALATDRWREVGLRKTLGAGEGQVIGQFWAEAAISTAVALAAGAALTELLLPGFGAMIGRPLTGLDHTTWLALPVLGLLVAGLVGAYPARMLSRPQPVEVLRGSLRFGRINARSRILVGAQLALSVFLIGGVLVLQRQMDFVLHRDLGFDRENVVVLNSGFVWDRSSEQGQAIRARFHALAEERPEIVGVTASWMTLGQDYSRGTGARADGQRVSVEFDGVDWGFVETLGLRLVEGRALSPAFPTDRDQAVLVTRSLVRAFGWSTGVGHSLELRGKRTVVGVIEDFTVNDLHQSLRPVCLYPDPDDWLQNLYVRIAPGNPAATLALLRRTWEEVAPDLPFRYSFLDQDVARQYDQEERWGRLIRWGAALAIGLACLGALGLVSLAAARRTREIGIRKVLGASAATVVSLLSREYLWLGLAASALAWPLAWVAGQRWLQTFAYRAEPSLFPYILASGMVLAAVLAVAVLQAWYASRLNPVDALRQE